jgi:hypothetical protein
MSINWILSAKLTNFLDSLIKASDFASTASDYYPFVGWSLGATMQGPNGAVTKVPPRYEVGLAATHDVPGNKIRIPSKEFGYVIFDPKPQDANSNRRLIDFDGKDIVVR